MRALLAAVLVAGLVAGCSSPTERAIEEAVPGTDVEIERGGERIIVEDDDGSATVETGGELPERIDDAFDVPADYVVDVTAEVVEGGTTFVSVSGHLERDDLASLTEELTAAVTAAGWTIDLTSGMGDEVQLIAASRGDEMLQISITATDGTSRFDVIINVSADGS